MGDCTEQFRELDRINTALADAKGKVSGSGPVQKPEKILGLLQEKRKAEEALRICLNQPTHGTVFPRYLVTTLLYTPPGIGSEVSYEAGSTAGITTDVTRSFKAGATLTASGKFNGSGVEASLGVKGGVKNGRSFEVNKERSSTVGLTSQIDEVDHSRDVFFIWTNVRVDIDQSKDGTLNVSLGLSGNGQLMDIVPLTVAELRGQASIPEKKKAKLVNLTPEDFRNILSLHPFIASNTVDPRRLRFVTALQISGPDHPGDSVLDSGRKVTDEQAEGVISGTSQELSVGLTLEVGFKLLTFLESSVKANLTWEWSYEKSTNITTGTKEEATISLRTTTLEYDDVIDVYQDMMFRTFAFASKTGRVRRTSAVISGVVTNLAHKPLINQRVVAIQTDGRAQETVTNAQGIYRLFAIPEGKLRIEVAEVVKEITLVSDQAIELSFQINGDNPPSSEPYQPKPKKY
jgi:hypothetical protein